MLEVPRLFGTPTNERRIIVQTRMGTNLENFVGPNPESQCRSRFELLCRTHGRNWRVRKPATGGYNCAGLAWASRRACLPAPGDWRTILKEDGYSPLQSGQEPDVGDIVVYIRPDDPQREILHVAKVCEMVQIAMGSSMPSSRRFPRALSKWDPTLGECIHAVNDVFLNGGEPFVVEFYTDRLVQPRENE